MSETHWEDAKKSHQKHLKFIFLTGLPILIITCIIICNNNELFSGKKNEDNKNVLSQDSELIFFPPADSEWDKFQDSDISKNVVGTQSIDTKSESILKKKVESAKKDEKKLNEIYQKNESNEIKKPVKAPVNINSKPAAVSSEKVKIDKKLYNIDTSQQYSFLLSDVQSRIIDRKDIIISLALELFYNDASDKHEILIRRDALKVIVKKVIQAKELNSIKKDQLSDELKNEMNSIFDRKTLNNVKIREFQIEKVDAQ